MAVVTAVATYLLGVLGGWCLRMIWVAVREFRRNMKALGRLDREDGSDG